MLSAFAFLSHLFGGLRSLPDLPLLPRYHSGAGHSYGGTGRRRSGRYIPAGPNRNCGWAGINPKSVHRATAVREAIARMDRLAAERFAYGRVQPSPGGGLEVDMLRPLQKRGEVYDHPGMGPRHVEMLPFFKA